MFTCEVSFGPCKPEYDLILLSFLFSAKEDQNTTLHTKIGRNGNYLFLFIFCKKKKEEEMTAGGLMITRTLYISII